MTIIPVHQVSFGEGIVTLATDGPLRGLQEIEPDESIYWKTRNGEMMYLQNASRVPIDFDVVEAVDYGP